MPTVESPPASPSKGEAFQPDPRLRKRMNPDGDGNYNNVEGANQPNFETTGSNTSFMESFDQPQNHAQSVIESINDMSTWTMEQVEAFYSAHGYKDEVDYVNKTEIDMGKLPSDTNRSMTPFSKFSLQMGIRVLELIRTMKKLSETTSSGSNSSSHDNSKSWGSGGGGGGGKTFDFGSSSGGGDGGYGRGGGGGGGGGGRACFKCNETGHMARDCPTGGGGGGGGRSFDFGSSSGGGGGGGRACFKCNETGHMARECPTGGGGGGGRGGGGRACFKCNETGHMARECPTGGGTGGGRGGGGGGYSRDTSFSSSWGGGGAKHGNDGGNDGNDRKRPRQDDRYWNPNSSSGGGGGGTYQSAPASLPQEESWD